jgi:hypothetical protein
MAKAVFTFIILLLIPINACTTESATVSLPTVIVSSTKRPTPDGPTVIPDSSTQKTDSIHLRIEFQTTSDWSDLTFFTPETILGVDLLSVEGNHTDYEITPEQASLSQPSMSAEKGSLVGVTFDIHLDIEALVNPQFMLLERGDLNSSMLKIYYVQNDELILLQEVVHNRLVMDQLGRNPYHFVLDLSAIQDLRMNQRF